MISEGLASSAKISSNIQTLQLLGARRSCGELENIGSQPIVTPTVKTKVELIMTTRWSQSTRTEQWYSSAKTVQVSERALANNVH